MSNFALPVDDNEITILGIINAIERAAALEFCEFLTHQFAALGQKKWFEDVRYFRKSNGDPFTYKHPADMRFILNESVQDDSQIWHLIPNMNNAWTTAATNLQGRLNNYHHGQLKADLQSLLQIATLFDSITSSPGLGVADWAKALKTRIKDILSGAFINSPAQGALAVEVPKAPEVVTELYDKTQKEIAKRPPLGSRWRGQKPQRKIVLDRATNDLYEDGLSVSHELGDLKEQAITSWLRYFPRGGEVWVDPDGASMAYVKGIARMVGWFGPEPEVGQDEVRGFVIPRDYEFTGKDIKDIGSGKFLTGNSIDSVEEIIEVLARSLVQNDRISITDYGDIFKPESDGTAKTITRVHKNTWFEGHLPG